MGTAFRQRFSSRKFVLRLDMAEVRANGDGEKIVHLRDISGTQWKSGIAAWLGWFFDGLDMHLYTLVATPFVAQLLMVDVRDDAVREKSSWIQAAFLVGWALGGGFFGRIGDRLGRSRALMLTILTYALFTGLSFFAQTWWHLLIYRFLAALGIGGEWAVGASLLSETWPAQWRHWMAAVLQSGVNLGVLLATLAGYCDFDARRVAESDGVSGRRFCRHCSCCGFAGRCRSRRSGTRRRTDADAEHAEVCGVVSGPVRRITVATILVCATVAHGALGIHVLVPAASAESAGRGRAGPMRKRTNWRRQGMALVMVASIVGNFVAAAIAGGPVIGRPSS